MPTTHLLARAVIRDAGYVLLVQADGQSHTFLPGGHVEADEGLEGCLCRELREELGLQATVGRYRGAVEHRWYRDRERQYELNHCFAVDVPSLQAGTVPQSHEDYLTFGWVSADHEALTEADLQPVPLRSLVADGETTDGPWWTSTLHEVPSTDTENEE